MLANFAFRGVTTAIRRPANVSAIAKRGPGRAIPVRYASRAIMPGATHLRNEAIPFRSACLVGEDGSLGPLTPLSQLLASLNPAEQFLELVGNNPEQPIVKLKNKKEHFQKQKEWNKRQKVVASSNVQKEIQMSWGVEVGDLTHKLKKVRKELEKGNRVELVFSPKVPQRPPTAAHMTARLQEATVHLVEFAREWSPRKVEGAVAILYLKGLEDAKKPEKPSKAS